MFRWHFLRCSSQFHSWNLQCIFALGLSICVVFDTQMVWEFVRDPCLCVFIQVGSIYGDFIRRNIHKDYFDGSTLIFHAGDRDRYRGWSQRTCNAIGRWAEHSVHEDWIRWISKAKCNQLLCIHAAQPNQTIKIQLNNTHLLELRTRTQQRNTSSSSTADLCLNNIYLCVRCSLARSVLHTFFRSAFIFYVTLNWMHLR